MNTPTERHVLDRSRPMLDGEPLDRRSAAWHRWARTEHLRRFPDVDEGTRRNLDAFVARAEREQAEDMSEEEVLAQGMLSCAVCEEWGTVPGSTRCQDCQEADWA